MEFIHKRIVAERDQGRPVVIVSTELDEVAALSDRIAVMYRGKIVDIVPPDTSREDLGLLMAGILPGAPTDDPPTPAVPGQGRDGDAVQDSTEVTDR